jgi:long-chain acyl-CoA synthetase
VHFRNNQALISAERVLQRLQKEVDVVNSALAPHEQIKRYKFVIDEWGVQTGELSPTLKLKRSVLYRKYEELIKQIFGTHEYEHE